MQVALFHNPNAGYGSHTRETLVGLLRRAGYEPTYFNLHESLDDPAALATGEFVVVAGGDGSLRRVALKLIGSDRALALLPMGTANNFARALGVDDTAEKIVAGWAHTPRQQIDVGTATGPWGRRCFLEGVGLGLFPRSSAIIRSIDGDSEREFHTAEDRLHRNRCVIAALAYEIHPVVTRLTVEGRDASGEFLLLQVMNLDRVGPGAQLVPASDPADGWLDLVRVSENERALLQDKMHDCLAGLSRPEQFDVRRCRSLAFSAGPCDLLIDDEVFALEARADVEIGIVPRALKLVLPALLGERHGRPLAPGGGSFTGPAAPRS